MNVVAIIQARMTSTRLPGKVLADLAGAPMLARVAERVALTHRLDRIWIACTDREADLPLEECARRLGLPVFRGSESDVLGRYRGCAQAAAADVIVRVTADCPLLDPDVIDRVVDMLVTRNVDYAANVLERSFPRGLDVEAFTYDALVRMDQLGTSAAAREHVTIPVRLEHPECFTALNVRSPTDDSDLRWTVDTPEDLAFARLIYRTLGLTGRAIGYQDLVRWCRANQAWARRDDGENTWDPSRLARRAAG